MAVPSNFKLCKLLHLAILPYIRQSIWVRHIYLSSSATWRIMILNYIETFIAQKLFNMGSSSLVCFLSLMRANTEWHRSAFLQCCHLAVDKRAISRFIIYSAAQSKWQYHRHWFCVQCNIITSEARLFLLTPVLVFQIQCVPHYYANYIMIDISKTMKAWCLIFLM